MATTKKKAVLATQPNKADQVFKALLDGWPLWRIEAVVNTVAKTPKERREVLLAVRVRLEQSAFVDPIVVKGFCVSSLQEIYAKMMKEGDYQGAIKALKEYYRVSNTAINESLTEDLAEETSEDDN